MFDGSMFLKLKRISNDYKRNVDQGIDDFCNRVENLFVSTYFEVVFFKKSFTWFRPISFLKESGLRIDRVFECEVMVPPGKTLTIACKYQVFGDRGTYRAEYKFDSVSQQRQTWIHVDRYH